jgi:hypothetical protein
VTPVQSISETDIMPESYANTSYANFCQHKQHAFAGVQLQSMLLTFPEKEFESFEQVIFSLRMK